MLLLLLLLPVCAVIVERGVCADWEKWQGKTGWEKSVFEALVSSWSGRHFEETALDFWGF